MVIIPSGRGVANRCSSVVRPSEVGTSTYFIRLCTPIVLTLEVKSLEVRSGFCRLVFGDERAAANSVLLQVVEASMKKKTEGRREDIYDQ